MKTAGSVLALFSVLFACIAFMFVWAGTENARFEWVAMQGDPPPEKDDEANLLAVKKREAALQETRKAIARPAQSAATNSAGGINFVLWINVSGFRGDYLEHTETPFLDSLAQKGSQTAELVPAFPSLHYPTLLSQATGRSVKDHGISSDKLRKPDTGEVVANPTDLSFLKAEPIWTTAKRQGLGVLVHHWPFSQQQPAENAADGFIPEVNLTSTAEERLNALLAAWTGHQKEPKIRLAMVNLLDLNVASRAYGTKQKETYEALQKLDTTLASFRDRLAEKWPTLRSAEGDRLHIIITTDHGMSDVKKVINFGVLMGDLAQKVDYAASDAIAHLWFKKQPEGTDLKKLEADYDSELKARIYWRTYTRSELPSEWNLGTGAQVGDRVLMLKSGYAFTDKTGSEPVFDPSESGGPFCGGGYWVADQARMMGQAFFSTLDGKGKVGSGLGSVDATQLFFTVCQLLDIEPPKGISGRALSL